MINERGIVYSFILLVAFMSGGFAQPGRDVIQRCMPEAPVTFLVLFENPGESSKDAFPGEFQKTARIPVLSLPGAGIYAFHQVHPGCVPDSGFLPLFTDYNQLPDLIRPEIASYFSSRFYERRKLHIRGWLLHAADTCSGKSSVPAMEFLYRGHTKDFHLLQTSGLSSDALMWAIDDVYSRQFLPVELLMIEHLLFRYLKKRLDRRKLRLTHPMANFADVVYPVYLPHLVITGRGDRVSWIIKKWPVLVHAFINDLSSLPSLEVKRNLVDQIAIRRASWQTALTLKVKLFLNYGYDDSLEHLQNQVRQIRMDILTKRIAQLFKRHGYECFWMREQAFPEKWPLDEYSFEIIENGKNGGNHD